MYVHIFYLRRSVMHCVLEEVGSWDHPVQGCPGVMIQTASVSLWRHSYFG